MADSNVPAVAPTEAQAPSGVPHSPEPPRKRIHPWNKFTSILVPTSLLRRQELSPSAKLMYGCLARRCGKVGERETNKKELAEDMGVDPRSIFNYLKELEECNLISITQRGFTDPNTYVFWDHPWMHERDGDMLKSSTHDEKESSPQWRKKSSTHVEKESSRTGRQALADPSEERDLKERNPKEKSTDITIAAQLIKHLNANAGTDFKPDGDTTTAIAARLCDVDGDVEGVRAMLTHQCAIWKDEPKTAQWLRPSTLFGVKKKFLDYYGQRNMPLESGTAQTARSNPVAVNGAIQTINRRLAEIDGSANSQDMKERRDLKRELDGLQQQQRKAAGL